jgi:signal transduction histidine kinase
MVDDQPAKLLSYEAMLADLDENLIKAETAREALAHLLREDIAVVLMDVQMPEIDGFELATMIRQHPRCQRTAIIFVSAVHMSDLDRVRGYETGAVDYVSVPVVPEILRAKMRVFIDLHRKTAELKRLNDELDARVRARTEELEDSLERLKESETRFRLQSQTLAEADRRKNEFLAMLAHELRNPLAPISNAVELMRLKADRSADLSGMHMIDRQVSHLVRLVDDLLDASRISRGKLVLSRKPVNLTQLIGETVESIGSPMKERRHEIKVILPSEPLYVHGDSVRLTQALLNLLSNAAKFTPVDGKITLSVEHLGDKVQVAVKDTGRGIKADDLPHVFEMFYQGADASGERSGLGLGLTLVKSLVEMHGGSVEARSGGDGQGSEFTIVLPVLAGAEHVDRSKVSTPTSLQSVPRRILVVDDNRDAADSLAQLLRMVGHDVAIAYDGGTAISAASTFRPDAVLLDIGMPGIDGYATARSIRGQPNGADVFLVATTGWGQPEDKRRAFEAGFDTHLVKPVSLDALLGAFEAHRRSAEADEAAAGPLAEPQRRVRQP